nr:hypothetical protein [Chloroflexota bacterium]
LYPVRVQVQHHRGFVFAGVAHTAGAATAEFGKRMFDVTVERFVELVREFQTIEIKPRVDHH